MKPIRRSDSAWLAILRSEQLPTVVTKLAPTVLLIFLALFLVWKYDPIIQSKIIPRISSVDVFGVKFEIAESRLQELTLPPAQSDDQQKKETERTPLTGDEKDQIVARLKLVGPVLQGRHILWVDDNPQWQVRERNFLQVIGVGVDCAQTNAKAYDLMAAQQSNGTPYDLVISDVGREHEGDETGFTLLKGLRKLGYTTDVIFYTTSTDSRPPEAFAMTTYTGQLLNYVFDVLEYRATSTPLIQGAITSPKK